MGENETCAASAAHPRARKGSASANGNELLHFKGAARDHVDIKGLHARISNTGVSQTLPHYVMRASI